LQPFLFGERIELDRGTASWLRIRKLISPVVAATDQDTCVGETAAKIGKTINYNIITRCKQSEIERGTVWPTGHNNSCLNWGDRKIINSEKLAII